MPQSRCSKDQSPAPAKPGIIPGRAIFRLLNSTFLFEKHDKGKTSIQMIKQIMEFSIMGRGSQAKLIIEGLIGLDINI